MVQSRKANGQFSKKITRNEASEVLKGNGQPKLLPTSPMGDWTESSQRVFLNRLTENIATTRTELFRNLIDPRRNINDECGYPDVISLEDYRTLYNRESVARRVVNLLPLESWSTQPEIFETEDVDQETEFEKAWKDLPQSLKRKSWFGGDSSNAIWEYLQRIDVLSGIGSFGIVLLGISDGKPLTEEASPAKGQKLLFIRTFDQSLVSIAKTDDDLASPRFGQPLTYNIRFNDVGEEHDLGGTLQGSSTASIGQGAHEHQVHWTRVIHVADNLGSSEIFGVPRMQGPFNRLADLRKIYAGSAEMYWKGAFPGIALATNPAMGFEGEISAEAAAEMKEQMEKYMNGLQRYFTLTGLQPHSIAPQVVDPTPQIDAYIKSICIQLGVPKRIFEGSERGELASSQDAKAWNRRLQNRQEMYLTPRIIIPFIDRLIWLQVLPEPDEGYEIVWPDLESLTEFERAEVANKRVEAMTKYIQGDGFSIMEPMDFYTRLGGMKQEESKAILEAVADKLQEEPDGTERSPLLTRVGGITGMADMFEKHSQGILDDSTLEEMLITFFQLSPEQAKKLIPVKPKQPAQPPEGKPLGVEKGGSFKGVESKTFGTE